MLKDVFGDNASKICFFPNGVIVIERVPEGQTVNQQCYRDISIELWKIVGKVDLISGGTSHVCTRTTLQSITPCL